MGSPLLSIIIPVYNSEDYIKECLDSIIKQSHDDYEIIIINDGSTDNSLKILESYADEYSFIKLFSQMNKGQSSARNLGLTHAEGDYVQFVDSDDRLVEGSLERIANLLSNGTVNLDAVFFDARVFFDAVALENFAEESYTRQKEYGYYESGKNLFADMFQSGDFSAQPCLLTVSREVLKGYDIHFTEGYIHEDEFFVFQVMYFAGGVYHLNEPLYERRVRPGSTMTAGNSLKRADGYTQAIDDFVEFMDGNSLEGIEREFNLNVKKLYLSALLHLYSVEPVDRNRRDKLHKLAKEFNYFDLQGFIATFFYPLVKVYRKIRNKLIGS